MDEQQVYNDYDSSLIITVMIQPMMIILTYFNSANRWFYDCGLIVG